MIRDLNAVKLQLELEKNMTEEANRTATLQSVTSGHHIWLSARGKLSGDRHRRAGRVCTFYYNPTRYARALRRLCLPSWLRPRLKLATGLSILIGRFYGPHNEGTPRRVRGPPPLVHEQLQIHVAAHGPP